MNSVEQELQTVHLDAETLAKRLNISVKTLYNWRYRGIAPRAMVYGGRPRWRLSDVIAWEQEQLEEPHPTQAGQPL